MYVFPLFHFMRSPIYKDVTTRRKKPILSVLICTLKNRNLKELLDELDYQIQMDQVQVLWLGDNKSMSVGAKRNKLLSIADGDYICFVDDDDMILDGYISEILESIKTGKPLICFNLKKTTDGHEEPPYRFSREYTAIHQTIRKEDGAIIKGYYPGHLCVWRSDIARRVQFPDISLSEDHRWAAEMTKHYDINDQVVIEKELYHYRFSRLGSETQKKR